MMLGAVRSVSDELLRRYNKPPFDLEQITGVVKEITTIDHIIFVGYDVPRMNPIWGSFSKYSERPTVYSALDTIVEIRYANHLSEVERRFVVAKELCHALDSSEGVHSVTDRAVERLVAGFSLLSSNERLSQVGQALAAELIAEMVAAELICPLRVRRQAVENRECDPERKIALAREHGLPEFYAGTAFNINYMNMLEIVLQNGS